MATDEFVREVAASPEELWAFLADPSNDARWRGTVRGAHILDGEIGQVGTRVDMACWVDEPGFEMSLTVVVTTADPPRELAFELQFEITTVHLTYRIAPADAGSELRAAVEVEAPGPVARVTMKAISADLQRDLDHLVALAADEGLVTA